MEAINHFPYFSEIEQTFVRRRGSGFFLSPKDWALIETWEKRGIPLHIAIRAIEGVFDDRDEKRLGRVSSLSYCVPAIEEQFSQWSAAQVGASLETEDFVYVPDPPCDVCGKQYCLTIHRDVEEPANAARGFEHEDYSTLFPNA